MRRYRNYVTLNYFDIEKEMDVEELKRYDRYAQDQIKRLEEEIEETKKYRLEIAQQAQKAYTENFTLELNFHRHTNYKNKILFRLSIQKVYANGQKVEIQKETFAGKERHIAIKEFKKLQKQYNGIQTNTNM